MQVSEEVERALVKLGPAKLSGRYDSEISSLLKPSKGFFLRGLDFSIEFYRL